MKGVGVRWGGTGKGGQWMKRVLVDAHTGDGGGSAKLRLVQPLYCGRVEHGALAHLHTGSVAGDALLLIGVASGTRISCLMSYVISLTLSAH